MADRLLSIKNQISDLESRSQNRMSIRTQREQEQEKERNKGGLFGGI